jgi:N-acetylmuramoyl-L-alanine amidase
MNIEWSPSPNFTKGRNGKKIIAIVNHITAGLMPGTLSWLKNPNAQASAHYLVTKAGLIFQLVKDEDTAWHAGIVNKPNWPLYDGSNPNRYTIGIEHECMSGGGLTEQQYQATLWLHRQLVAKHGIPVDTEHIIGHNRIDTVNRPNDPGPNFPWQRLFNDLANLYPAVKIKVGLQVLQGILVNGVTYAPVRDLANSLGRTVEWNAQMNAAIIPPVFNVNLQPAPAGKVNIVTGSLVFQGLLVNGKSFAPVRQLAESLGKTVNWDGVTQTVTII